MTRGPAPLTGIDIALPVAWARGFVTLCIRGRGCVCHFVIHAEGYTAVVVIQRCRRLHGSLSEMASQCREAIDQVRLVPPGLCRSLELWAYNRHGVIRLFRIAGTGLVELKRDGEPMNGDGNPPAGAHGEGGA
jgi:hypothetical protein